MGTALLGLVGMAAIILSAPEGRRGSMFRRADSIEQTADEGPARPRTEDEYLRELAVLNVTDKPAALALAEAGERWYAPTGEAAEERRALRVTLLKDLGHEEEARKSAREFIAAFPESRYLPKVEPIARASAPLASGPTTVTAGASVPPTLRPAASATASASDGAPTEPASSQPERAPRTSP